MQSKAIEKFLKDNVVKFQVACKVSDEINKHLIEMKSVDNVIRNMLIGSISRKIGEGIKIKKRTNKESGVVTYYAYIKYLK